MNFLIFVGVLWIVICCYISRTECSYEDKIKIESKTIYVTYDRPSKNGINAFNQAIDISMFHDVKPTKCKDVSYCRKWDDFAKFTVTRQNENCDIYELTTDYNVSLSVIFNTTNLHLYGAEEASYQRWPIESLTFNQMPFVSSENNSQAILAPVWFTNSGSYVHVSEEVPLFITVNTTLLKLSANRTAPYIRGKFTHLKYKVCNYPNIKNAYENYIQEIGKPEGVPDYQMVKYPIWSTWVNYKWNINDTVVREFANLIQKYKFPNSQLEIDDKWETCYGSLTIDTKRFSNMKELVEELKKLGFRVTIWVHPFINIGCEPYFSLAKKKGYLVKSENGSVLTPWWNGLGAHIDFTHPEAAEWYATRLKQLLEKTGINSFKFDAGESSFNPQLPIFHRMENDHPETNLKSYIATISQFGEMVEVRGARGTQRYPIFVRMLDRGTNWNGYSGLVTMIPEILHMNIIGYPFALPDMIGGNGYDNSVVTEEMFIRWLQISTFMPVLQFSHPPWNFGEKVVNITLKFIDLHAKYAPKIYSLMKESTVKPKPVNAPLWWIDPNDPETYTIDNEFLLGDDILVAPVIEEGARSRDIYLPKGTWKDENRKDAELITGPKWLKNYPAELEVVPYFTKVPSHGMSFMPTTLLVASLILLLFVLGR